jgi:pimeloyl-ACP methyl ester carboxylesterase
MTVALLNGIELSYQVDGPPDAPLVVLVMGTGSPGRVWRTHQVPALSGAGYRVVTYDSRGIGATGAAAVSATGPAAVSMDDLVADLAALIEHLGGGPARVIGTSLGARVVCELALRRPELVDRVVALAGHARLDPVQRALTLGQQQLYDQGVTLPPGYLAAVTSVLNLSPTTLRDERGVRDWLDVFEFAGTPIGAGERAQLAVSSELTDRRGAYREIGVPTLVVGFADDVMIPTYLCREVAEAIPGARYVEVPDTGHFGYLERPAEVNKVLLDFLIK